MDDLKCRSRLNLYVPGDDDMHVEVCVLELGHDHYHRSADDFTWWLPDHDAGRAE